MPLTNSAKFFRINPHLDGDNWHNFSITLQTNYFALQLLVIRPPPAAIFI